MQHQITLSPYETRYVWERAVGMMPAAGAHSLNTCLAHAIGEVLYARAGHTEIRVHDVPLFNGGSGQAVIDPATDEIIVTTGHHG
jgi:hypothetical protein